MISKDQLIQMRQHAIKPDEKLPAVFSVLSDTGRFRIFKLLMKYNELCVTQIANVLNTSVPAASQQLKLMEMIGLVNRERKGQMMCYNIKRDTKIVKSLVKVINQFTPTI